jgi:hypothetical protein
MLGPEGATPTPKPLTLGGPSARVPDATEGAPPFINRRLSVAEWDAYVAGYDFGPLPPSRLVLHHTVVPTEAQWAGLATMRGMQRYYAGLGWSAGPHLYAGPDGIWLATPLYDIGIHAGAGNGSVRQGWYSIGLEMVGNFDRERPAGAVWANALAVMAGLSRRLDIPPRQLISFHRDYTNQKSCPGWAVAQGWVWGAVEAALAPAPAAAYDELSPIMGAAQLSAAQAAAAVHRRGSVYTAYDLQVITELYWAYAASVGLNADLAWAQCIHETSAEQADHAWWPLSSWWAQRPRRNPAGLGVTGRTQRARPASIDRLIDGSVIGQWTKRPDGLWAEGLSFPSWEHAIRAHLGRLLLYVQGQTGTADQVAMARYAHACRPLDPRLWGSVATLRALGAAHNPVNIGQPRARWAGWAVPGDDYGAQIAEVANAIRGSV